MDSSSLKMCQNVIKNVLLQTSRIDFANFCSPRKKCHHSISTMPIHLLSGLKICQICELFAKTIEFFFEQTKSSKNTGEKAMCICWWNRPLGNYYYCTCSPVAPLVVLAVLVGVSVGVLDGLAVNCFVIIVINLATVGVACISTGLVTQGHSIRLPRRPFFLRPTSPFNL